MKTGYARVSIAGQDLTAQREQLIALGVDESRIHVDHGLAGTGRARPGLETALAAVRGDVRSGDILGVTKLNRLARSVPDARAIADQLVEGGAALSLAGSVYDPHDPVGRIFFNVLDMVAEYEADLFRMHTRESMAIAKARGRFERRAREQHAGELHRPERSARQVLETNVHSHHRGTYDSSTCHP